METFFSSTKVKIYASIFAAAASYIVAIFIDLEEITNEEGFVTTGIIIAIMFFVGIKKIREYRKD